METISSIIIGIIGTAFGIVLTKFTERYLKKKNLFKIKKESRLFIADINNVIEWGWDEEKLLRKLIGLDYDTTEHLNENNEGTPNQWGPVFKYNTECWKLLASNEKELVGYWSFFPLKKEFYHRVTKGETADSEITLDKVELMDKPGVYNIYFVIICIKENYRHKGFPMLLQSLIDKLNELTSSGLRINNVCANAFSASGELLCRNFGLKRTIPHKQYGVMYEGTYIDMCRSQHGLDKLKLPRLYENEVPKLLSIAL